MVDYKSQQPAGMAYSAHLPKESTTDLSQWIPLYPPKVKAYFHLEPEKG